MTRAPASMQASIPSASSWGWALGASKSPAAASAKTGRTRSVQSGQIAGALEPRLAHKMPATNVPCRQAALVACAQAAAAPGASRMLPARSECVMATGPSINPTAISDRPVESSIKEGRLTRSRGVMGLRDGARKHTQLSQTDQKRGSEDCTPADGTFSCPSLNVAPASASLN